MVKVIEYESERTPLLAQEKEINVNEVIPEYSINASTDNLPILGSSSSTEVLLPPKSKQNSFFTIFSLWNAMMGTSILTMPWAIEQAGLSFGIICMILVMGVCLYTAYRVMELPSLMGVDMEVADYSDLCDELLKYGTKWIALFFSVFALVGGVVVYWILMSNFLYNIVSFVYFKSTNSSWVVIGNSSHTDVYCPSPVPSVINYSVVSYCADHTNLLSKHHEHAMFDEVWTLKTTPVFLVLIVMCLVNYKSATVFTKLNALAFTSVLFLFGFVSYKAYTWGINMDVHDHRKWNYIPEFNWNFPALTGTLTLAFFIHNCVISIVKNQQKPENNARDLSLAYVCVCVTYLVVGIVFYVSFPLNKLCLEDNLLNNFHDADVLTFVARCFLLVQMAAVLPLLMFVIRSQVLYQIFGNKPHEYKHIVPINVLLITVGVIFAVFYPHISFLIRYTGALCGLVYTFTLPCLTYMKAMHRLGKLTKTKIFIHSFLIALGAINLISQFLVSQRF